MLLASYLFDRLLSYDQLALVASTSSNVLTQRLGLGAFVPIDIMQLDDGSVLVYPGEYQQFERKVELDHFASEKLFRIRVTVQPRQRFALRRGAIVLEKLVGAERE